MLATRKLHVLQPSAQHIVDYVNALIEVNGYAYAITNQDLPMLERAPQHYADFVELFIPVKQHALDWSTNIFVSLVQLPRTLSESASSLFDMEQSMIDAFLQRLIVEPSDAAAKKSLAAALKTLSGAISSQVRSVEQLEAQLTVFAADVSRDAPALISIAQKALDAVQEDKDKIQQATSDMARVREAVRNAQTLLTIAEIGIGVSIFVGLVGLVVVFIPGAQKFGAAIIVASVAAFAGSVAGTVIESKRITALQAELQVFQHDIDAYNRDILLLLGVAEHFNLLYQANQKAQGALAVVKSMWLQLRTAVDEVNKTLTDVSGDVTSAHYQQAADDFNLAAAHWSDVVRFAKALADIDYKWQDKDGTWHSYGSDAAPGLDAGKVHLSAEHTALVANAREEAA